MYGIYILLTLAVGAILCRYTTISQTSALDDLMLIGVILATQLSRIPNLTFAASFCFRFSFLVWNWLGLCFGVFCFLFFFILSHPR